MAEPIGSTQTFLQYLQLFWANRRLLLQTAIYALLASVAIAFLIPVRYQSVTRLMPPDSQSGSGLGLLAAMAERGGVGGIGGVAGDLLGIKSSGALFVGILGSDTVEDGLINKFQLKKVYHVSTIEDARKELAEHTDISEDRKSGIISIGITDHDPQRGAAMAQEYATELDRLVAQVSTSSARRERMFLEERLQKVKTDLDAAATNFSEFASKNTAIDIPAQGRAMVEAAATLQGQLIATQAELSGLEQVYADSNVRVRATEARVNELQKKLNELGGAGTQSELKSDNSLYPSIRKLPLLGVTYADLYRQTKIQETVYQLLTQQYELAKVQEAKEIPTVKILDAALVPTKKSFPPRGMIVALGTMLGISLALTWLVAKTHWDTMDASDPRRLFATEVFTTVKAQIRAFSRNGTGGSPNGPGERTTWSEPPNNTKNQMVERVEVLEATIDAGKIRRPLAGMAAVSGLLLAAFVAVVTNSLEVFLIGLAFAFLPLIGVFFPTIVVALFLFLNLLIPKVPLIEIRGYIVPIRIEDVFLACALICLLLRYVIFREKPAPNPLSKWMAIFSVLTCLSFLFGLVVLGTVPGAKVGFLFWLRGPEYFAASYLCLLGSLVGEGIEEF